MHVPTTYYSASSIRTTFPTWISVPGVIRKYHDSVSCFPPLCVYMSLYFKKSPSKWYCKKGKELNKQPQSHHNWNNSLSWRSCFIKHPYSILSILKCMSVGFLFSIFEFGKHFKICGLWASRIYTILFGPKNNPARPSIAKITIPILQLGKLRFKEVRQLASGHKASQCRLALCPDS